jgi:hypothetical protein
MRHHIDGGTRPQETNPSYRLDRINDRWPRKGAQGTADMKGLADSLDHLAKHLQAMAGAELEDISKAIDELFGQEQRDIFKRRHDRRNSSGPGTRNCVLARSSLRPSSPRRSACAKCRATTSIP